MIYRYHILGCLYNNEIRTSEERMRVLFIVRLHLAYVIIVIERALHDLLNDLICVNFGRWYVLQCSRCVARKLKRDKNIFEFVRQIIINDIPNRRDSFDINNIAIITNAYKIQYRLLNIVLCFRVFPAMLCNLSLLFLRISNVLFRPTRVLLSTGNITRRTAFIRLFMYMLDMMVLHTSRRHAF